MCGPIFLQSATNDSTSVTNERRAKTTGRRVKSVKMVQKFYKMVLTHKKQNSQFFKFRKEAFSKGPYNMT